MIAGARLKEVNVTLSALNILEVWRELGGGELRGKRARAFWRDGDGYNVSVDPVKGVFYDHRDGRGGILDLVEVARGVDRRGAIEWLEVHCGLEPNQKPSLEEWQRDTEDRQAAEEWAICAEALAALSLEDLDSADPQRAAITRLLLMIKGGQSSMLVAYQEWKTAEPTLTAAMVSAGRMSDERRQRKLAVFVRRL